MTSTRYRCAGCGNLTRFDVVTDRRTRAYHHYTVGGTLQVEDEQVLAEDVVEVSCRWCGHGRAIESLAAEAVPDDTNPDSAPSGPPSHPSATLGAPSGNRDPGDR